jgi:Malectin domain
VISGSTDPSSTWSSIAGVGGYAGNQFLHDRWGPRTFAYIATGFARGASHALTLGYAETHPLNCGVGKRVFGISANGSLLVPIPDVFANVSCKKATFTVVADSMGKIEVKFERARESICRVPSFCASVDLCLSSSPMAHAMKSTYTVMHNLL